MRKVKGCAMLPDWTILFIVLRENIFNKYIFMRPSLRRDILWYTNVRLSVRPFHMSHSNLKNPWPIHFKLRTDIGIDSLTVCILFNFSFQSCGTLFIKLQAIFRMSHCKLRTPSPIHFKLRTVIGIDSHYYSTIDGIS